MLNAKTLRREYDNFVDQKEAFIDALIADHSRKVLREIAGRLSVPTVNKSHAEVALLLYRSSLRIFLLGAAIDDDLDSEDFESKIQQLVSEQSDADIRSAQSWLQSRASYRWPANQLTIEDAGHLRILANRSGKPINHIVREAIRQYVAVTMKR